MGTLRFVSFLLFAAIASVNAQHGNRRHRPRTATCVIANDKVKGVITLFQRRPADPVKVEGEIDGLQPGLHGFHVHQYGDISNGCASTAGHFNPFRKDHGAPDDNHRHIGDLGNIEANKNGKAEINIHDSQLKLCGPVSIIGRAIVIHANEDDLGKGGDEGSKKTGNAGARVACCIIGLAQTK